jgi:23S rRNA (pseudouridine1915-N3)-methyltransferase
MAVILLVMGKTDVGWVKEGLDLYVSRISHYIRFSVKEIPELKNASSIGKDQIKKKEGDLILKNICSEDFVVLLDEHGEEFRSVEFAKKLEKRISSSGKNIIFVIGGAYGFSDAVYDRCDAKLSLSRLTFSHQMARTIFAEQLYRAFTIMKGEPYHHE